ncbi:MAG: hypothetical protein WA001_02820 [Patescibacteria group bacterium]
MPTAPDDRKALQEVLCYCGGDIRKFSEFTSLETFLAEVEHVDRVHGPTFRSIIALTDSSAGGALGLLRNRFEICKKFPRLKYSLWVAYSGIVAGPRLLDFARSVGKFAEEEGDEPRLLITNAGEPLLIVTSGCKNTLRLKEIAKQALDIVELRGTGTRPFPTASSSQTMRAVDPNALIKKP